MHACAQVQKALVDVENMFDLLNTEPKVRDAPGAKVRGGGGGAVCGAVEVEGP